MVEVDMGVTQGVHELARLQPSHVGNHVGQQGVAGKLIKNTYFITIFNSSIFLVGFKIIRACHNHFSAYINDFQESLSIRGSI